MRSIKKNLKIIQNRLIPELNSKLGVDINTTPSRLNNTQVSFSGSSEDGTRLIIEFNSNHLEVESDDEVFVYIYYRQGGTKGGIINLTDIDGAVNAISEDLQELGFKTSEDEVEPEPEVEEKPIKHKSVVSEPEVPEEYEEQKPEVTSTEEIEDDFDNCMSILKQEGKINYLLEASVMTKVSDIDYRVLTIDLFYVSGNICLLQTNGISPKVDKTVKWDTAKNYIINVSNKVSGVTSFILYDDTGKEVEVYDNTNDSEDVNIGINI